MFVRSARGGLSCAGFTMVELIMVIVIIGILGAIGASRFFDSSAFASKAYADQAKSVIRFAQKLAIAQNRQVYVRSEPTGLAVCLQPACAASDQAIASGGNSGSAATKSYCKLNNVYQPNWMCEGTPITVQVSSEAARNEMSAGGYFSFDSMGRPYNRNDAVGGPSTFSSMTLTFASGTNNFAIKIEAETGYVHDTP